MLALTRRLHVGLLILFGAILAQGCGYERTMIFSSPSRRAAVEVWQRRFANEWGTKIKFVSAKKNVMLAEIKNDALFYFVHVYWSPSETNIGVLATGFNTCRIAYDTEAGKSIPFDQIRDKFGDSIRSTYDLSSDEDPFRWASSYDAGVAFFKHHPEIHLSYH